MITLDSLFMLSVGQAPLDLQSFDCGRETVTNFFRNEAQAYQDELFGKTYFYVHPDNPTDVIAGFTVANASIFTKHFGVDNKYKGNHLGEQIIEFVTKWFTNNRNKSGCRHLIVDAYNEAKLIDYYQRNGLNLFFSTIEQEMKYRNWNSEKDGELETRLMYRDLILLRRNTIR